MQLADELCYNKQRVMYLHQLNNQSNYQMLINLTHQSNNRQQTH